MQVNTLYFFKLYVFNWLMYLITMSVLIKFQSKSFYVQMQEKQNLGQLENVLAS